MLQGIRRGAKPGGYLVVVDRRRGTLRVWGPRELRQEKHFRIAETTVVREAREGGLLLTFEKKHGRYLLTESEQIESSR